MVVEIYETCDESGEVIFVNGIEHTRDELRCVLPDPARLTELVARAHGG